MKQLFYTAVLLLTFGAASAQTDRTGTQTPTPKTNDATMQSGGEQDGKSQTNRDKGKTGKKTNKTKSTTSGTHATDGSIRNNGSGTTGSGSTGSGNTGSNPNGTGVSPNGTGTMPTGNGTTTK